jgi:glucan 1,3-beta-glucosidase
MAAFSSHPAFFYAFILSLLVLIVQGRPEKSEPVHLKHQLRSLNSPHIHKRQNISNFELTQARKLVEEAVAQQNIYNNYRVANPKRNTYVSRHSPEAKSSKNKRENGPVAPTLNATVLAAASRLAEFNAAAQFANGTLHKKYPQPQYLTKFNSATNVTKRAYGDAGYEDGLSYGDPYWVAEVSRTGHAPMGYDDSYMVRFTKRMD